jgi:hypothetical protein
LPNSFSTTIAGLMTFLVHPLAGRLRVDQRRTPAPDCAAAPRPATWGRDRPIDDAGSLWPEHRNLGAALRQVEPAARHGAGADQREQLAPGLAVILGREGLGGALVELGQAGARLDLKPVPQHHLIAVIRHRPRPLNPAAIFDR